MFRLYSAIWRASAGRQIILIMLSVAIAGLAAVPLEFQRDIVNHLTSDDVGTEKLIQLGIGMMAVILLSLALKWVLSYRAGTLGEDMIRLIRQRLLWRSTDLKDSDEGLRKGTMTTAISAEAEELGKFAGGAFSDPVVQIGTLISVIGYISSTQPGLGLIALSMIVPQIIIVLVSQRKVNTFVAERVRILRGATDRLTTEDIEAVERDINTMFDDIYDTRRRMFLWKLSAKFLLSVINGAGTVGILMLGGYLVLQGKTDVGTVVAATSGLSRIQGPTAFLIAFYRQVSANRIKYELMLELFGPDPTRYRYRPNA
ncbi:MULTISPECIES: ABC transporter transmembrane domain-containing protein [unclassified Ruegeria]|uniref:ABC transporter transmembrane domain-containing protein n=1 Tax=unclassified Ruegeria TaxID=2625375 RepID=UPI001490F38B|nr:MULTISPECIES: ABC transporter transmembrane domain-containing protein [unclassified Ruegeria]NOC45199.1 ABC transporter ATP-binding protein [Ruegeria sp. HKCCD7559]NOD83953.1 ABC transporter ATP-binding protein [Ruegeria sp. HKCCD6119]